MDMKVDRLSYRSGFHITATNASLPRKLEDSQRRVVAVVVVVVAVLGKLVKNNIYLFVGCSLSRALEVWLAMSCERVGVGAQLLADLLTISLLAGCH